MCFQLTGNPARESLTKVTFTVKIARTSATLPERARIEIMPITSLLTTLRRWCGLMLLKKNLLARDILRPRNRANFGCEQELKAATVSTKVRSFAVGFKPFMYHLLQ